MAKSATSDAAVKILFMTGTSFAIVQILVQTLSLTDRLAVRRPTGQLAFETIS
jgi:hypothetical protein